MYSNGFIPGSTLHSGFRGAKLDISERKAGKGIFTAYEKNSGALLSRSPQFAGIIHTYIYNK